MNDTLRRIDWSQLWYPGPARVFTDEELRRAAADEPGPTFWLVALFNAAALALAPAMVAPPALRWPLVGVVVLSIAFAAGWVLPLWRHPTRGRLAWAMLPWAGALGLVAAVLRAAAPTMDRQAYRWLLETGMACMVLGTSGLWALVVYRSHQIEARLKELAERNEALALARRLSAAQLQPHFLFNTLASIQHWVDTGDPRAGSALRSLTAYLRALLPMFEHAVHPLTDELAAMRRYLEVMQARLGERLVWRFEGAVPAHATIPPGLALTLLENAVEHGVQGSLHGAEVRVRVGASAGRLQLDLLDTGPGLPQPLTEGVGLRNCRQRLQQAWGDAASLQLMPRSDGPGTCARLLLPLLIPSESVA